MYHKPSGRIGAVIIFFALLFVFTKWGPAINFSTTSQTKGDPFIVSGEGKVYVTPDIAKITVGVEESGTVLATIQKNVNSKTQKLTDAIKKIGVEEKDIKTTSYNLYPQYDYSTTPNKITGYQISTSYEVTIRDFDKINDIITAATTAGANMEGNISFDINDTTKNEKLNEARKIAVTNAKEKAEGLASSAGLTLGKIINIAESQSSNVVRPMYAAAGEAKIDLAATPSIQAGQTELSTIVSLSYEIR